MKLDLNHPETGPFPTDIFTVADDAHNTGRRVGLQPQLSIPFDGPIDVATVSSAAVFLITLGEFGARLASRATAD